MNPTPKSGHYRDPREKFFQQLLKDHPGLPAVAHAVLEGQAWLRGAEMHRKAIQHR